MQLIKQNIIKAILGIVVSLVVVAGAFFVSSGTYPVINIRKMFDSSISEFEEERTQRNEESLIKKPTPSQILTTSPIPTISPTLIPTATPTLVPTSTLIPTPTPRFIATPTPTPKTTRKI